jgi:nucleotide-binding universal stress UspA family protein
MTQDQAQTPFIVVGVDGSEASESALRWAAGQAGLTGATLRAVTAWQVPLRTYGGAMPSPVSHEVDDDAHRQLNETVAHVLGNEPGPPIVTAVLQGHPAPALVEAAAGAELLVVGSRGYGYFAGMLLGSVSAYCAAHAPCPVVIIREQEE